MLFSFMPYCSKAVLPIEKEMMTEIDERMNLADDNMDESRMSFYVEQMNSFRDNIYSDAKSRIVESQKNMKRYYDKKHGRKKVQIYVFPSN